MVFVFGSVYAVDYICRFAYVEPALHPQNEAYLIMMDKFLMCCCNQFTSILLKIFASMFIMDIGLKFSFLVESLLGFGIRMIWYHKMIWGVFHHFGLFVIVSEGMVPAPLCVSSRIRL